MIFYLKTGLLKVAISRTIKLNVQAWLYQPEAKISDIKLTKLDITVLPK